MKGSRTFGKLVKNDWKILFWGNQREHTGISSVKQCLIIVAENLRFLIQHLMLLKNYKTALKTNSKGIGW